MISCVNKSSQRNAKTSQSDAREHITGCLVFDLFLVQMPAYRPGRSISCFFNAVFCLNRSSYLGGCFCFGVVFGGWGWSRLTACSLHELESPLTLSRREAWDRTDRSRSGRSTLSNFHKIRGFIANDQSDPLMFRLSKCKSFETKLTVNG